MSRLLKSEHTQLGHTATSERGNAKWRLITQLSVYPASGSYGQSLVGVTADGPEATAVLYLTSTAVLELVKGFLLEALKKPISMVADDEFRQIITQVQAALVAGDEEAAAIVRAVFDSHKTSS